MKKFLLSILALLMLGGNLAWGAFVTVSGTVTIEATDAEKSTLGSVKLLIGNPNESYQVSEKPLPATTNYSINYYSGKFMFGLGTNKKFVNDNWDGTGLSQDWVFVDENGDEVNPLVVDLSSASGEVTVNLTIKPKGNGGGGGGGDDDPKASLIGRVLDGHPMCLVGVKVDISGSEGYHKSTYTEFNAAKYNDKVSCAIGYDFTGLALGTYTLTYSKAGYETKTQEITITEEGEIKAPDVTLDAQYTFYGSLTYTNTAGETAYAANATVTAYDGPGADANVLGTATSNGEADWSMTFKCQSGITVYFDAVHPDIEVAERTAVQTHESANGIQVNIVCVPKGYDANKATLTLSVNNQAMGSVEGNDQYDKGTSVTAKAIPNDGYVFVKWTEGETQVSTDAEYTFTLNGDRTLMAWFAEQSTPPVTEEVTLTLSSNNDAWGSVSPLGTTTYDKGASVTATATPNEGYKFVAWQENGVNVDAAEVVYTFTINADRTLTAVFEKDETPVTPPEPPVVEQVTLALSVSPAEGGSVSQSGDGTYDKGASVTATATANEGYKFVAWKAGETEKSTDAAYTFTINENLALTAVFEKDEPTPPVVEKVTLALSAIPTEGGTVSQSGNGTYDKGASVTATATPNAGYKFVAWQENGADVHSETVYTFTIEDDRELTALFEQLPPVVEEFTLTLEANNAEWGSVEGAGTYGEGTEVTVKATANQGYKFRAWTKGEEVVSTKAEYTFTLTENLTLTAVFVKEQAATATLILEVNDEAMGTVSGAGRYDKGSTVTVKATPNKGYVFQAWKYGGKTVSTAAEYTFALTEDITLVAVFAEGEANEALELAAWDIYTDNGQIVLRSNTACNYEVYALTGVLVNDGRMGAGTCRITVDRSGLYMVRRTSATGISVKKVVVR